MTAQARKFPSLARSIRTPWSRACSTRKTFSWFRAIAMAAHSNGTKAAVTPERLKTAVLTAPHHGPNPGTEFPKLTEMKLVRGARRPARLHRRAATRCRPELRPAGDARGGGAFPPRVASGETRRRPRAAVGDVEVKRPQDFRAVRILRSAAVSAKWKERKPASARSVSISETE